MRKTGLLIGLIIFSLALAACIFEPKPAPIREIPRCENRQVFAESGEITYKYQPLAQNTCVAFLTPFDQAGWFESRLNSRRLRGETSFKLGCTHCPGGNKDCNSPSNCGGCASLSLNFDLTRLPEDAEIVTAKLAVYALDNQDNLSQAVVQGRVNVGADYAVISQNPEKSGSWTLYDVTPFACRGVVERRNSVNIDLSLPCGSQPRTTLATLALNTGQGPTLILEYR
ncbi:MAG: hypothetical protein AB1641_03640 [Thermodesulfobacteriota bacterium]